MLNFDKIYEEYFDDVFRYLRGLTLNEDLAEELTEETFFKALKALPEFNGKCDVRVWLCQIAKNSYFSYLKKYKRISDEKDFEKVMICEENLEEILVNKEIAFQLHEILHQLNEPYKEVFTLRVFGELPFKEIGLLFDKSEHWACVTYHRAKENIKKKMEKQLWDSC